MQKINRIKRFSMLIEKLEGNRYPSMQDFLNYFESSGYSVSQRTIERDLKKVLFYSFTMRQWRDECNKEGQNVALRDIEKALYLYGVQLAKKVKP